MDIFRQARKVGMAELRRRILEVVQSRPINGSHGVSVMDVDGTMVLLIGEIHENPGRCNVDSNAVDVVRDLVLGPFGQHDHVTLLVEGFPQDLLPDADAMRTHTSRRYPDAARLARCIQSQQFGCLYERGLGGLDALRYAKARVHLSSLLGNPHGARINSRILFFDVRRDLDMMNPFASWKKDLEEKNVIASLRNVEQILRFLIPIADARWSLAFQHTILAPFFSWADRLRERPSQEAYRNLFVRVPDIVATNYMLASMAKRQKQKGLIIVYGGDDHRMGIHRLLTERMPGLSVQTLALSLDRNSGSCSRPTTSYFHSILSFFHQKIFR